jgi:hypothetical protein
VRVCCRRSAGTWFARFSSSLARLDCIVQFGSVCDEWRPDERVNTLRQNTAASQVGEAQLRRILQTYARYYNDLRTHRSLDKDAPLSRPVQRIGRIKSHALLGGLHHCYVRV